MRLFLAFFCFLLLSACAEQADKPLSAWPISQQNHLSASLSPSGKRLLLSSLSSGAQLYHYDNQAQNWQPLFHWQHQNDSEQTLFHTHISPDETVALTANETEFALWRISDGQSLGFYKISLSSIRDIAISDKAQKVAIARADGVIVIFSPSTGHRLEFLGHTEKVNSIAISARGDWVLSGGNDYVAYYWHAATGKIKHRFVHPSRLTKVAIDANKEYLFTADSKNNAHIWQQESGKRYTDLAIHERQKVFSTVHFNSQKDLLITGSPNRDISVWQLSSGQRLNHFLASTKADSKIPSAVIYDLTLTPMLTRNENQIASVSSAGIVEIWPLPK
ncbi:hypothetical protein HR060_02275 [Catenovulum sp. SM1970]|uniref:WD40 repeat domain-containing protein n=1 Tax=Marinifaba aquimaris TaxID=2741323 RepID=UPI001572397D|nr:hypothetical protein [Marinifaba aquimaris]NTS75682.1 hypothetical protein [Marinifaba aquimaris]